MLQQGFSGDARRGCNRADYLVIRVDRPCRPVRLITPARSRVTAAGVRV
jgi:hypothetical protein